MESLPLPASAARVSRRAMAWAIDFLIVLVPSVALLIAALTSLVHALPGYVGGVASSGLVNVIMHHGEGVGGLGAAASEEWTSFVQPLVWSLLAVPVIQFGYLGVALAWRGRTLGAIVMGVRVGAATDPTGLLRARALRRAFLTTLIESGFLCLALAVVTIGQLSIGGLLVAAAVMAYWLNLLLLLGPRRRTLVDRFAGTVVVRSARFGAAAISGPAVAVAVSGPAAAVSGPAPAVSSWPAPVPTLRPAEPQRALASEPPAVPLPAATWPGADPWSASQLSADSLSPMSLPPTPAPSTPLAATPPLGTAHAATPPPGVSIPAVPPQAVEPWAAVAPPSWPAPSRPPVAGPPAGGPSAIGRAGQAAADAAAVAGQLAREGAESIARSQPVQQALNSPTGQRAQELSARASDSARRLSGRAQEMWTDRHRRRDPGNALPPADNEPPQ